jgi:hypothetical protein
LKLEIRSSKENPRNLNEAWNPAVSEDLEKRLTTAGVNLSE